MQFSLQGLHKTSEFEQDIPWGLRDRNKTHRQGRHNDDVKRAGNEFRNTGQFICRASVFVWSLISARGTGCMQKGRRGNGRLLSKTMPNFMSTWPPSVKPQHTQGEHTQPHYLIVARVRLNIDNLYLSCWWHTSSFTQISSLVKSFTNACVEIQRDGRKFLDRFKSYFGSQISSQSLNEIHICRLQRKSATKGAFFIYFCLWLSVRVGACCPLTFDLVSQ